jgi:peptidoglycan/xylan/chitin deacetylase (PgdA/CDA1 family)
MTEKLFSFRWDIDHRACMTDGLPIIMQVCEELQVPNTFFVNMGKSTNLREWIGKGLRGSKAKFTDTESVNLIQKIGWARFLYETVRGRPVGYSFIPQLHELLEAGHELGLHGGSDHVVWSRNFATMPEEIIRADVDETLADYKSHFGMPAGFSSPGFKSDERVMKMVDDLGFRYNGDAIGGTPRIAEARGAKLNHWTIPVTVCGPRTIPFIEWKSARGESDDQILANFEEQIAGEQFVVLYGHPCYEGLRKDLLRRILTRVQQQGFTVVTHEEIAHRLSESAVRIH